MNLNDKNGHRETCVMTGRRPRADRIQQTCLLIASWALLLAVVNPKVGHAQVARVGAHPLPSMTVSDQEFLTGRKDGKPVILAGQLRIPRDRALSRDGPGSRLRRTSRECGRLGPLP